MKEQFIRFGFITLLSFSLAAPVYADNQLKGDHLEKHKQHGHKDEQNHGKHKHEAKGHNRNQLKQDGHDAKENSNNQGGDHSTHQHAEWVTPPPSYAKMVSDRWTDSAAIGRGKGLFQTNCALCHGPDGRGTGPGAKALSHAPADLNNHFHMKPGDGDAYLFWRVSEGGMVEPFKSRKSAMPAFKTVLSEDQRWDVLSYVHTQFHKGFKSETLPTAVTGEGKIIAVVPSSEQVVVDHKAIKGFMDAMTMGYKVHPTSLLKEVQAGDQVRFTIDTQKNVIVKIEKIK